MNDRRMVGPGHDPWTVALFRAADPRTAVGCGVLIDRRRVLTCWHVVDGSHGDGTGLVAAFPKAGLPRNTRAEVSAIRAYRDLDVAVLHLARPAPAEAVPAPLRSPRPADLAGYQWWAFGFPRDSASGSDAHGQVGIPLSYGRVRLDTRSRYVVRAGFSGTGVWSRDFHAVVGLVVQAQAGGRNAGDAEAITLHQLEREMPGEGLHDLTVWSIAMAGEAALEAWGWSLSSDVEAVRHWRPRARGVSVNTEGGYRFRGRTTALTEISEWLQRARPDPRVLIVTGSPGVGKSAVLGRIVTTADQGVRDAIPDEDQNVCAPLGAIACAVHVKGKTALDVAVEIARAASVHLPHTVDDLVPALQRKLARSRRPGRFNLVVDALDEATTLAQTRLIISALLLPVVRTCSRFGAQVIVGSRRVDDGGDLIRSFGRGAAVIDLDKEKYFAEDDLEEYALATLALEGDQRPGSPYAADDVARPVARRIAALADRNFLIAGLIARSHGMYDEQAVDPATLSFSATVDEALAEYLARLPPVEGVLATTLLTALAYAQAPGMSMELWRVALEALDVAVTREALTTFVGSSAANFLVETSDDAGTARFRLFHQALNDALVKTRSPAGARHDDERALARHFIRHGQHLGWARSDPYLLRLLPAYAARAGMIDALLTDDAFLLHADLPRLTHLAESAATAAGRDRARLLRLTPHAINAPPVERAALFGVTAELEQLPDAFTAWRGVPYRARWASVPGRAEHSVLEGHAGAVRAICAVPSNRLPRLATVGDFPYVRLWDPATGRHWDLPVREGARAGDALPGPFFAVCPVPVGDRILVATAGRGGRVYFVDPVELRPAGSIGGSGTTIRALCALTVDGTSYLASGGDDGMIRMWKLADGRARSFPAHDGPVRSVTTMGDAGRQVILSAGDDYTARIWDPAGTTPIGTLSSHVDRVRAARAIRLGDRDLVATANYTETLVWEWRARAKPLRLTGHTRAVLAMEAVPVGERAVLATGSADGDIRIWDPRAGRCLRVLSGHTEAVNAICTVVVDDHPYLATASRDRTARLWDLAAEAGATGRRHRVSAASAVQVKTRAVAGVDGDTGVIRLRDAETGTELRTMAGRIGSVHNMCTVQIGLRDFIVVAGDSGVIQTWDPLHGTQLLTSVQRYERIQAVCPFRTEDGQTLLAITGNGRTIQLLRPDNGRILQRQRLSSLLLPNDLHEHLKQVRVMVQVVGGSTAVLATAGDNAVMLWNSQGRHLGSLWGHQEAVRALATATLNGRTLLASAGEDQTIRLWDPWNRSNVGHFTGHTDGVNTLCPVTVDGRSMLASGSQDRTVKIWDLASQSLALSIPVHYPALACLEVAGLLVVGLTAGALALDLNTGENDLLHFREV